jgi:hypothetical protein
MADTPKAPKAVAAPAVLFDRLSSDAEALMKIRKGEKPRKFSDKIFLSTTNDMMDNLLSANPKLTEAEAYSKAARAAEKKLAWEREQKPALVKRYGQLGASTYSDTNLQKQRNVRDVVEQRIKKANEFLDQPTEPWTPPPSELQAFDRASIKDALTGFPDVEQSKFPRDTPAKASTKYVDELYTDPVNRDLIKKQIMRGLPLGGESFYASLYPVKQAVMEAGMPASKFDKWIHSLAPASARNSILNENAVGQLMRDMHARGIPLTEENVTREMARFKEKYGMSLPLMFKTHGQGVANILEGGQDLREMSKANIPTNYKIPTYGTQKAGDFAHSVVLDVHEAGGQTLGSKYHPYFNEQGGFGNTEYNAGEQGMLGIARELGLPGGMAQAGRWFGGGELTGLKSPRGDALDLLEKQVAYTLKQQGKQPNPALVRKEVLRQIETGEGDLLPWYKGEALPDVRQTGLQRKDGGEVHMAEGGGRLGLLSAMMKLKADADAAYKARRATPELVKSDRVEAMREILPADVAAANKAAFMAKSKDPRRFYHGTKSDIRKFDPRTAKTVFVTPEPKFADDFAFEGQMESGRLTTDNINKANVMPLRVQVENPFDPEDRAHMQALEDEVLKRFGSHGQQVHSHLHALRDPDNSPNNWSYIEHPDIQKALKGMGHDAYYSTEGGIKNLGVYDPRRIKSDIGNTGAYDIEDADISKKDGGWVYG